MKSKTLLAILFVFVISIQCDHSEPLVVPSSYDDLQLEYSQAKEGIHKNRLLWEMAKWQIEKEFDVRKADSLYVEAIQMATELDDEDLILRSCIQFLSNFQEGATKNDNPSYQTAIDRATFLLGNKNEEEAFDDWLVVIAANLMMKESEDGDPNLQEAIRKAEDMKSHALGCKNYLHRIHAYILSGNILRATGGSLETAHRNYGEAAVLAVEIEHKDDRLRADYQLHGRFGDLYQWDLENPEKAIEYWLKQKKVLAEMQSVDSLKMMWNKFHIAECYMNIPNKESSCRIQLDQILDFTKRNGYRKLNVYAHSAYRSLLIRQSKPQGYIDLYRNRYPEALAYLKDNDPNLYYLIESRIEEESGQIDSARTKYSIAHEKLEDNGHHHRTYHETYANFLMRNGDTLDALKEFELAYTLAGSDNHKYRIGSQLFSIYDQVGDTTRGYQYLKIASQLERQFRFDKEASRFLLMEIKQQEDRNESLKKLTKEKKKRKDGRQIITIFLIVIALFVVLIVVSSLVVSEALIEMLGFFSILAIFELVILLVNKQIEPVTSQSIFAKYGITILILSVIFPLHHLIETRLTDYLKRKKLIRKPKQIHIRKALAALWPWLAREKGEDRDHS